MPPIDPELEYAHPEFDPASILSHENLEKIREYRWDPPIAEMVASLGLEMTTHEVLSYDGEPIVVSVFRREGSTNNAAPAFFNVHGGGMVSGRATYWLDHVLRWVVEYDALAATVEYRLAPEHPDPTPLEDVYAALSWFARSHPVSRVIVVGESAGGGLAAGAVLLARDRGGPTVAAQLLHCPMLDDRDRTISSRQTVDGVPWTRSDNDFGWNALLGERRGTDRVSSYSAPSRMVDLTGLPPTFMDVGSVDLFRDEVVEFASRIWEGGGDAELHVWAGGVHSFTWWKPTAAISLAATAASDDWVGRQIRR